MCDEGRKERGKDSFTIIYANLHRWLCLRRLLADMSRCRAIGIIGIP